MKDKIDSVITDFLLWFILGACCLCYSIYWVNFAELHLDLPFLDFPIFIGEIALTLCLILLFIRWFIDSYPFNGWHGLLFIYVVWVLIKAFLGYHTYGPLSFRTAALFYYPLFAVISYHFFKLEYVNKKNALLFLTAFILIKITVNFHPYFLYPSLILFIILALKTEIRWLQWLCFILWPFLFPFQKFFQDSKSALTGNIAGLSGLVLIFFFFLAKLKKKHRIILICFVFSLMMAGILKYGNRSQIKSFLAPVTLVEQFQQADQYIAPRKEIFRPKKLGVSLYQPENPSTAQAHPLPSKQGNDKNKPLSVDTKNSREDVQGTIKYKFEMVKIAIAGTIQDETKNAILDIKKSIPEKDPQRQAIAALEKAAETISYEAVKVLFQNRDKLLKKLETAPDKKIDGSIPIQKSIELTVSKAIEDIAEAKDFIIKDSLRFVGQEKKGMVNDIRNMPSKISSGNMEDGLREKKESAVEKTIVALDRYISPVDDSKEAHEARSAGDEQSNMLFRLFVWRDMLSELKTTKPFPWLGINFGKPQRSISLEILNRAEGEWRRDGWITAHNSYLDFLYRGGLVGAAIVVGLFFVFLRLVKLSVTLKSVTGILLASIFIYWLTMANFLVFLEMPYQAIPFWTLWGMYLAYMKSQAIKTA